MIFAAGFAMKGVYPFGENSALVVDGVHQYTAFYKELLSQLEKGAGWTYSTHSMGYDFYGLFCYYLSSPFSLLCCCFCEITANFFRIKEKSCHIIGDTENSADVTAFFERICVR